MAKRPTASVPKGFFRQTRLDFLKRLGRTMAMSLLAAALYTLIIGPRNLKGVADGLFISGGLLLFVSIIPLATQLLNRLKLPFRLSQDDFHDVIHKEQGRYQEDEASIYLYGLSGIIIVAISFIVGFYIS